MLLYSYYDISHILYTKVSKNKKTKKLVKFFLLSERGGVTSHPCHPPPPLARACDSYVPYVTYVPFGPYVPYVRCVGWKPRLLIYMNDPWRRGRGKEGGN